MPVSVADQLDLRLAWQRVLSDNTKERVFVRHPYEERLIAHDLDGWLMELDSDLREDRYHAGPLLICNVPKPEGGVRPGCHLSLRDQVVFAAAIGAVAPQVRSEMRWANRPIDFSYQLRDIASSSEWFQNPFNCWRSFDRKSLAKIDTGTPYVIIADIAGYYQNVDIDLMISDLRHVGMDHELSEFVKTLLYRWSQALVPGRGVPQGFSASDLLAKLYLNAVDRSLFDQGYFHYRYVDDFRIFCESLPQAKRALVELTRLLRRRGLVLQTAKSRIHRADVARVSIQDIQPILNGILAEYVGEIADLFGIQHPYFSLFDAEDLIAENPENAPIEVIRQAYQAYVIDADSGSFKKTLFRFLLSRLGNASDRFAVHHVVGLLREHPEETPNVLKYIKRVGAVTDTESAIVEYLQSAEAVYPHQVYEFLDWRGRIAEEASEDVVALARRYAFDEPGAGYVRASARHLLGLYGSIADLERLEDGYSHATGDLERAEIVSCLSRMERGRRNSFLARIRDDGELTRRAVAEVRQVR